MLSLQVLHHQSICSSGRSDSASPTVITSSSYSVCESLPSHPAVAGI